MGYSETYPPDNTSACPWGARGAREGHPLLLFVGIGVVFCRGGQATGAVRQSARARRSFFLSCFFVFCFFFNFLFLNWIFFLVLCECGCGGGMVQAYGVRVGKRESKKRRSVVWGEGIRRGPGTRRQPCGAAGRAGARYPS
jgi:hypothetical protein